MGLMNLLDRMFPGKPLSYFAKQEGTPFHQATCDLCGASFSWLETTVAYPIPLSENPSKPAREKIDVGGWCVKCQKFICPREADFIPLPQGGNDWWIPGCRRCQIPLLGKAHFDKPQHS